MSSSDYADSSICSCKKIPHFGTHEKWSLQNGIRYAIYDTLAVSYLHRVVEEHWTLQQLKDSNMHLLLIGKKPTTSNNYDLELISDDNIQINMSHEPLYEFIFDDNPKPDLILHIDDTDLKSTTIMWLMTTRIIRSHYLFKNNHQK